MNFRSSATRLPPSRLRSSMESQKDTLIMIFSAALKNVETNAITKRSILSIAATELHSFGYASDSSYGACVDVRCKHGEGIHCDLLA